MSALKAHLVTGFIKNPDIKTGIFLFYGPDQGLVYENSKQLFKCFDKQAREPLSKTTFEADDILANPSILAKEANTIPMFGGMPAIRIRSATNRLTPIIKQLLQDIPNAIIIVEAANLTPRDSLRALIDKDKNNSRALPCYADNEQNLSSLIRQSFQEANISIDQTAISTLRDYLGNDREITRREIEKLTLYALESKIITSKDIIALCGDNSILAIDQILDSAGTGRVDLLDKAISQAFQSNIDPQRLLISALNHFTTLRKMRSDMEKCNKSAGEILNTQKPRPHFSRKSALEQQLRLYNDMRLSSACDRIYQAIADTRKSAKLDSSITHRALIAIGIAAARY